jgi:hypothetical protein
MKWMSSGAKRQCDRALGPPGRPAAAGTSVALPGPEPDQPNASATQPNASYHCHGCPRRNPPCSGREAPRAPMQNRRTNPIHCGDRRGRPTAPGGGEGADSRRRCRGPAGRPGHRPRGRPRGGARAGPPGSASPAARGSTWQARLELRASLSGARLMAVGCSTIAQARRIQTDPRTSPRPRGGRGRPGRAG